MCCRPEVRTGALDSGSGFFRAGKRVPTDSMMEMTSHERFREFQSWLVMCAALGRPKRLKWANSAEQIIRRLFPIMSNSLRSFSRASRQTSAADENCLERPNDLSSSPQTARKEATDDSRPFLATWRNHRERSHRPARNKVARALPPPVARPYNPQRRPEREARGAGRPCLERWRATTSPSTKATPGGFKQPRPHRVARRKKSKSERPPSRGRVPT